jgi:hypothetical protein
MTALRRQQVLDPAAAGIGEQPQLAVADFALEEAEHLLRISAFSPLGLRHGRTSRSAQTEIHRPAAAHMRARLTEMVEDVLIAATRFLQGVGKNCEPLWVEVARGKVAHGRRPRPDAG